ncbi:hypothetical protein [Symmachiella dynata]|uniref:TubC N-terminal docking domain-related protein n=1 Tax=Symmachiella dynata TaxID=2527995 RepID=UPI0030EC14C2
MIAVSELLAECDALDVKLLPVAGGGLTIDAPRGVLTPEFVARLKEYKATICDALQSRQAITSNEKDAGADDETDWFEHIADDERQNPAKCQYCGMHSRHWSMCPTRYDDQLTIVPTGRFRGSRLDQCPNSYLRQLIRSKWRWVREDLRNEAYRIIYLRTHFRTTD